MAIIKLKSIAINNFKGVKFLKLNMEGKNCNISGRNGSGKTTVYKAYYWCLTGKTLEPNEVVQTLNVYNEVIHKIETSVVVELEIDGSQQVTIERRLSEKWKAQGMPDEQLIGTEQSRFYNKVPLSQKEFTAKLNAICDLDTWLMLSNINAFMSLKTEDRRKRLMAIAGEVDEEELIKPYPLVKQALVTEKKTIEELQRQTLSTKKRANEELQAIPEQINAQDRLRVDADFAALETEKAELDVKIADIDKKMQGSTEQLQAAKEHEEKVSAARTAVDSYRTTWQKKRQSDIDNISNQIQTATQELQDARTTERKHFADNEERIKQKVAVSEEFMQKRKEWEELNAKTFDSTWTEERECPTCGHVFTGEEATQRKEKAIQEFNKLKSEGLLTLQNEAVRLNEQKTVLTGSINEYAQIIQPQDKTQLNAKETALNELKQQQSALWNKRIEDDSEYMSLVAAVEALNVKASAETPSTDNEAKQQLVARRDEVLKLLAGKDTNKKIADEKIRLGERSNELAQIIADCDKTLYEIKNYKKARVDAVEDKVNALFSIAMWKFFEKNTSNDDYTDICMCTHNGVDYNSTNTADKINLGVDIIASLSKAYDIIAPLFVDSKESCAKLIPVENQIICLEHIVNSDLSLNYNI